jgi:asparagine synthase (glutamine-hydrolysing)
MCGIGGILRTDGQRIPEAWVRLIDARIAHRGPDDAGVFRDHVEHVAGTERRIVEIVLIHRRLSILDHEGGRQPMISAGGRTPDEDLVAVVFNGCLYNHGVLREELEQRGHRFQSDHSDTEVLIHAYREWGRSLSDHLEGMYAFALWDRGTRSLVVGRDWFGEKPLYLRQGIGDGGATTAFASDARALALLDPRLDHVPGTGGATAAADPRLTAWTAGYLQLGYSTQRTTVYGAGEERVGAVPPTIIELIDELMPAKLSETDTSADIEQLIDQAVEKRLDADVPIGCFLSGGVDSSLIAHFASQHVDRLKTFSMRMPDDRYDETEHAEAVAGLIGSQHTTLEPTGRAADDLVELVHTLGQPFGDSSLLPTYWISRAAREHVSVALSGDGGDELFLGYDRYTAARALVRHRRALRWMPESFLDRTEPKSRKHRLGRLGVMARDLPALGILSMESVFSQPMIKALMDGAPEAPFEQVPGFDPMQSLRRWDLLHYLPDDLLLKVDTASMAVALEVRAPFLDRALVRAALGAPTWQLMPKGRRKGLLRDIARKYLPDSIVDRPKMGFAIPIGQWFRNDFGGMRTLMLDHLRSADPLGPIPVERRALRQLVGDHLENRRDHGQRMFALLTLSIWAQMR